MRTIDDLRNELFDTLARLKDKTDPMDVARAKAVVEVASVIVDTAKVEIAMVEATGSVGTGFIPNREALPAAPVRPQLRAAGR
jgi:hypothetical protein